MTEKLGQSLTICETALTKNNQIEDALAVRDFRLTLIETMTNPIEDRAEAPADSSGWIDLYDPEKWEIKGGSASFKFEDGAIVGRTKPDVPSTYLATRENFADFELEFEMKFDKELSSGVQIRSKIVEPGTPKENVHGPQVDIARSPGKSGFLFEQGTGRGFLNGENGAHTFLKNGEWNRFKIVANGQRIQTWVNDNPVSDLSDENCYLNFSSGVIALQVFRTKSETPYEFRWRNMRIRKLTDSEPASSTPPPETAWIELFNGRDLDGWLPVDRGGWEARNISIWRSGSVEPYKIGKTVPLTEMEIEGEMWTTPDGNGGIIIENVAELALTGTKGVGAGGIWTGGIWGAGPNLKNDTTPPTNAIRDKTWIPFRIRYENDLFQTWISGKSVSELKVAPLAQKERTISLQGKKPGTVGYRNLRVRDISVGK